VGTVAHDGPACPTANYLDRCRHIARTRVHESLAALQDVRGYTVEALEVLCSTSTAVAGAVTIRSSAHGERGPCGPIGLEGVHSGDWNPSPERSFRSVPSGGGG
jgi:hypothetical protein